MDDDRLVNIYKNCINAISEDKPNKEEAESRLKLIENELSGTDTLRLLFRAKKREENQEFTLKNPLITAETIFGLRKFPSMK